VHGVAQEVTLENMNDRPKLRITHYPDVSVRTRAAGTILEFDSLADLGSHILDAATDVNEKGASGYWVAAPVDGVRSNANTAPTLVIALDWDDAGEPPEPTHPALRGLRYFAHTTDSHTADDPRWRVWVELDREYSPEEVGRAQSPIDGVYLRAASQPAYVPTRADEMEWIANDVAGAPLSLERWGATRPVEPAQPLDLVTILSPQPRQPTLASTHALVARWLANPAGTNRLAGATGSVLAAWGWGDDAIAAWLRSLFARADPKLAKHVGDALRAAATRRAGGTVPGLPTLETELGVPFTYELSAVFEAAVVDPLSPSDGPEVDQDGWVTAAAIAAWTPPPVDWLVEGLALAPGAPVLLTGYGGSGKTTLAQHLAVCVSARGLAGPSVLGVLKVAHPGPVTHIDYEQGIELTARRYRDLGLAADSTLRFRAPPTSMPSLAGDPQSRAWLADAARGQRLVLIDSFVAGLGAALDDENAAGVREPLDWLGRVSIETGAVVLVIHHSRKTQRGGDSRQTARGSSAITDAVSVHLNYERTAEGGGAVLRAAKLRRSPPAGMLAGLLSEGVLVTPQLTLGSLDPQPETAATAAGGDLGPQIITLFASTEWGGNRGRSTSDVCRALGLKAQGADWTRVRTVLEGLCADGLVIRSEAGKHPTWSLA
jgi:energy-coupling factor transporter ATP-binding protein EcfA2